MTRSAQLYLMTGPDAGTVFDLDANEIIIGRSKSSDIVLNSRQVSRQHAAIRYADGVYTLEDLESSGGTYINKSRIRSSQLAHGDVLNLAGTECRFIYEDAPTLSEAPTMIESAVDPTVLARPPVKLIKRDPTPESVYNPRTSPLGFLNTPPYAAHSGRRQRGWIVALVVFILVIIGILWMVL
jgi:pSer/pThr/pTyr-binding forkhead associated (FHA) protein